MLLVSIKIPKYQDKTNLFEDFIMYANIHELSCISIFCKNDSKVDTYMLEFIAENITDFHINTIKDWLSIKLPLINFNLIKNESKISIVPEEKNIVKSFHLS
jgi:hypothetical protein